jgi:energy-coupling factor transporter ATP-binding protein EcfA2
LRRELPDLIDAFKQYSQPFNAGQHFIEWGAVWMTGTTVGRSMGTRLRGQLTCPNLFVLLVAGPGSGKSQTVKAVKSVMLPATGFSFIPASITRAGLQDYMQDNMKTMIAPDGSQIPSNECIALSDEMQGILPEHDIGHLTLYNELYDVQSVYKARTRSHGEINLQSPYCSIITGAQPAFLSTTLPEQAWGMGFMSRSILVFDLPRERTSAFEFADVDHTLKSKIIHDLKQIRTLHGHFKWSKAAVQLYEEWWVKLGGPPVPSNKRLAMGYNARRDLHFFKLAMIFSLSRTNELIVTLEDAKRAIELLVGTENRMRHIFNEMAATGVSAAYGDVIEAVRIRTADEPGYMDESELVHMLMDRYQPTQVKVLIEQMLTSQVLKTVSGPVNAVGFRRFVPGDKVGMI